MDEKELAYWARFAPTYDREVRELFPRYETLHELAGAVLSDALGPEARLLVVGAGTGFETVRLAIDHRGWKFTAVDPSAGMLERGKCLALEEGVADRIEWVAADLADLPPCDPFDAVTSLLVLHFLPDDGTKLALIREMASRLSQEGLFVSAELMGEPGTPAYERSYRLWEGQSLVVAEDADYVRKAFERRRTSLSWISWDRTRDLVSEAGLGEPNAFYKELLLTAYAATRSIGLKKVCQ